MILAGIGCFFYPDFREWRTQQEVERIIERFQKKDETSEKLSGKETIPKSKSESTEDGKDSAERYPGESDFSGLYDQMQRYNERLAAEGQQIVDAWSCEQTPVDVSVLPKGDGSIGFIQIPDMEVRLPLFIGASEENLAQGAAVLSETSMPVGGRNTNCVIAGHRGYRGSAYFQHIENLKSGSMVFIVNPWETLEYRVTDTKIIDPSDVSSVLIQEGKDMVTLFSCHPYGGGGKYRYVVYCDRAEGEAKEENQEETNGEEVSDADSQRENYAKTSGASDASGIPGEEPDQREKQDLVFWERKMRIAVPAVTVLLAAAAAVLRWIRNDIT